MSSSNVNAVRKRKSPDTINRNTNPLKYTKKESDLKNRLFTKNNEGVANLFASEETDKSSFAGNLERAIEANNAFKASSQAILATQKIHQTQSILSSSTKQSQKKPVVTSKSDFDIPTSKSLGKTAGRAAGIVSMMGTSSAGLLFSSIPAHEVLGATVLVGAATYYTAKVIVDKLAQKVESLTKQATEAKHLPNN